MRNVRGEIFKKLYYLLNNTIHTKVSDKISYSSWSLVFSTIEQEVFNAAVGNIVNEIKDSISE
jgi:hypothetical protein